MEGNKGGGGFWGIGFFLFLELGMWVSANVVFQVQHKFSGEKRSLTAFKAHDSDRHRRILAAVDIPIGGNESPTSIALYFTKIKIGTPPKDYTVQVDTGSDLLWVNCAGCDNCPKKSDLRIPLSLYDPKASSSSRTITCDQAFCAAVLDVDGCTVGTPCPYGVKYGDESSTSGYYVEDRVRLDRVSGNFRTAAMNGSVTFGCAVKQSGGLAKPKQALDGILGLGPANLSIISQLAAAKKVKMAFSHCLDGSNGGGGIFAIGQVVKPKVDTTRMVPRELHYNVNLKAIEVGGDFLRLSTDEFDDSGGGGDGTRGTIVDSGTTLAYFPDDVYNQLLKKISGAQPNVKTHIVDDGPFKCFEYHGNVDDGFPDVTFHFENSLTLKVYPRQYLFEYEEDGWIGWCVDFQGNGGPTKDGKDVILLGDLVLTDKLVTYDLENQTIGWTEYNCSSSVKVKDEASGDVYEVGAHNISLSLRVYNDGIGMILALVAVFIGIFIN